MYPLLLIVIVLSVSWTNFPTLTNPAYHKQQSEKENRVVKRGYRHGYRHGDNGRNLGNGPHYGSDDESCTSDNKVDEDRKRQCFALNCMITRKQSRKWVVSRCFSMWWKGMNGTLGYKNVAVSLFWELHSSVLAVIIIVFDSKISHCTV